MAKPVRSTNIESLDLAMKKPQDKKTETASIIRSFRENYEAYSAHMATNIDESKKGEPDFYSIGRLPFPEIKKDSPFYAWNSFIQQLVKFIDGDDRQAYVEELLKLENLVSIATGGDSCDADKVLETILGEFESNAGFSNVITIKDTDKVLSAEDFNKILSDGHPFIDYGASPQHGPYSHRVQMYIIFQYFITKGNLYRFVSNDELRTLFIDISLRFPDLMSNSTSPVNNIIAAFYRLAGTKEFIEAFDWQSFYKNVETFNSRANTGKQVPDRLNEPSVWGQLFDRLGYAAYFSVPSTYGMLQALGAFNKLPTLGVPNIKGDPHLKKTMDITPRMHKEERIQKSSHDNTTYHHTAGTLFGSVPAERNAGEPAARNAGEPTLKTTSKK